MFIYEDMNFKIRLIKKNLILRNYKKNCSLVHLMTKMQDKTNFFFADYSVF